MEPASPLAALARRYASASKSPTATNVVGRARGRLREQGQSPRFELRSPNHLNVALRTSHLVLVKVIGLEPTTPCMQSRFPASAETPYLLDVSFQQVTAKELKSLELGSSEGIQFTQSHPWGVIRRLGRIVALSRHDWSLPDLRQSPLATPTEDAGGHLLSRSLERCQDPRVAAEIELESPNVSKN